MWVATNLFFCFLSFVFVFVYFFHSFFSITAVQGTNKNSKCVLYLFYCVSLHNPCYTIVIISFILKADLPLFSVLRLTLDRGMECLSFSVDTAGSSVRTHDVPPRWDPASLSVKRYATLSCVISSHM